MFTKYHDQLIEDLKNTLLFNKDPDDKVNEDPDDNVYHFAKQIMYCLQPAVRSNITVFNLNSDINLSETIFRSIFRCTLINFEDHFNLSV